MEKIYFIGINGIGMSGLAKIMSVKGYKVKGADICTNYVTEELLKMGIEVFNNHDAENVKDVDFVIASSAIKETNAEYDYAVKNNIKILKRGELLAKLLNESNGIAIAGTHGKTTTTSLMSMLLIEKDPTIVVGGILPIIGSNSKVGYGDYFIAEADESDNSFLYMKPKYSIITNIDRDHIEVHGNIDNIKKSFLKFIENTEKEVLVCLDCNNIKSILDKVDRNKITTYGIDSKNADVVAENIEVIDKKTFFDVYIGRENRGRYFINIPGKHNILNSLPTIYLALKFGITEEKIYELLSQFKGSKRRYDILFEGYPCDNKKINIKIIDDYAHHPTEIKATLNAAKSIENSRIVAIFQPHRYSRINFLLDEFEGCFDDADKLLMLPIYEAGEENIYNIDVDKLLSKIEHKNFEVMSNEKDIRKYITRAKKDTVFIFMGAGNISTYAHNIVDTFIEE